MLYLFPEDYIQTKSLRDVLKTDERLLMFLINPRSQQHLQHSLDKAYLTIIRDHMYSDFSIISSITTLHNICK